MPTQQKLERRLGGLSIGTFAVFIYLFAVIFNDYVKGVQENLFVDFDVKTITAGDYSVEFDIDEGQYAKFKNHYYK